MAQPGDVALCTLRVLSGLHEGATLALRPGICRVGSGAEADVALCDETVAPLHATIEISGSTVRVGAVADAVALGDAAPLAAGQAEVAALPLSLRIGGVRLNLDPPQATAPSRCRRRTLWFGAVGMIVLSGAAGSVWHQVWPKAEAAPAAAPAHPHPAVMSASPAPVSTPSVAVSPARPGRTGATAARDALRAHLDAVGLPGVELIAEAGVVTARGAIEPAGLEAWRAAQAWFDGHAGGAALVNQVQVRAPRAPAFAIESVWAGRDPNIVVAGQKYFEEAALPDGWIVEHIEPHRVVLRRGTARVAVPY